MYKERLIEYIEDDAIYQEWIGTDNEDISDYDRFCIEHCQDIQELLNEVENLHNKIEKAIEYIEEHRIKNPYHYEYNCFMGNARASDLLEILKDSDIDE